MRPTIRAEVIDNPTLERDLSTNAVINRNRTEYTRRLQTKNINKKKESELENLKSEVAQLKELVNSLISNQK